MIDDEAFGWMGKCVFFIGWIQKEYKNWIAADRTSKSKARCRICNKSFDVASMGEAALVSHMKGKKHTYLMGLKPKESLVSFLAAPELPSELSEVEKSSSDLR